jgi:hypothetical protein
VFTNAQSLPSDPAGGKGRVTAESTAEKLAVLTAQAGDQAESMNTPAARAAADVAFGADAQEFRALGYARKLNTGPGRSTKDWMRALRDGELPDL